MEYALIIVVALVIVAAIRFFVIRSKRNSSFSDESIANASIPSSSNSIAVIQGSEVTIPLRQLPATTDFGEKNLFEITNRTVIARISDTIPGAAQAAAKTITNNALKNAELFRLDIPSAALTKSREVDGAFRAFSRGKNEISKNANLMKVDPSQITKASALANSVANVMNVGSLVVGQYYMAEISAKLDAMNNTINKISDFQEKEFRSRVLSLIARVGVISQFSVEILENDEQRKIKLSSLDDLNGNATELLGQVNETITGIVQSTLTPDYKEYQTKVEDFTILVEYQNVLVTILEKIGNLTYLLGKGDTSWDLSYSLYNPYLEQSRKTRGILEEWHDKQVTALKIDLDKNRKSKSGVEGFFAAFPAFVIDDKWKYKELKKGLAQKITTQAQMNLNQTNEPKAVYDEDIQIVIKDGKYYYLTGDLHEHK